MHKHLKTIPITELFILERLLYTLSPLKQPLIALTVGIPDGLLHCLHAEAQTSEINHYSRPPECDGKSESRFHSVPLKAYIKAAKVQE